MYIKEFNEITKDDIGIAGGKGANLGELTRIQMKVPNGFIITSEAYRYYMKENHLFDWLKQRLGKMNGDKNELLRLAKEIRRQIVLGDVPEKLKSEILLSYYQIIGETCVAVRSSATAEDLPDASFAGQQETFLNVSENDLIEKVKECYASLWTDRAIVYRHNQGFDHFHVALAIVVQEMVESEIAGVLFTVNPTNANKKEIQINAAYGLGESVVSGQVTPDEYICDRNGNIIHQIIGTKEIAIVYDEIGTKELSVPKTRQNQKALSDTQIKELITHALKIEKHYGFPLDIEWAIAKQSVFILQARAITTLSSTETKEIIPEIKVTKRVKELMTFMLEKNPYAYYPLDYDLSMVLGVQKEKALKDIGIDVDMELHIDDNGIMALPSGKIKINKQIIHIIQTIKKWLHTDQEIKEATSIMAENQRKIKKLEDSDIESFHLMECKNTWEELYEMMECNAYARFRYALFPSMILGRQIDPILRKIDKNLTSYDLLVDLSFKTANINKEMKELVEIIEKDNHLKSSILDGITYENMIKDYAFIEKDFDNFLNRNGYKSDFNCYCLCASSWLEDKDRLLQVMRPMLLSNNNKENKVNKKMTYSNLLQQIKKHTNSKRYQKLLLRIEHYRFCHVYREESQYFWEESFALCRRLYQRMVTLFDNKIEDNDFMYLFYLEMIEVLEQGYISSTLKEKIRQRKENRELAEKTWEKAQLSVLKENNDSDILYGVCGSVGEIVGKVCIITSPQEFHKLQKGDILVCKYTDPEWTPLFTLASAVVSDTGGALSHAAIVAREYGIPAVLGTGMGTVKLKDGDRVVVDAYKGEVKKIE